MVAGFGADFGFEVFGRTFAHQAHLRGGVARAAQEGRLAAQHFHAVERTGIHAAPTCPRVFAETGAAVGYAVHLEVFHFHAARVQAGIAVAAAAAAFDGYAVGLLHHFAQAVEFPVFHLFRGGYAHALRRFAQGYGDAQRGVGAAGGIALVERGGFCAGNGDRIQGGFVFGKGKQRHQRQREQSGTAFRVFHKDVLGGG